MYFSILIERNSGTVYTSNKNIEYIVNNQLTSHIYAFDHQNNLSAFFMVNRMKIDKCNLAYTNHVE